MTIGAGLFYTRSLKIRNTQVKTSYLLLLRALSMPVNCLRVLSTTLYYLM